MSEQVSKEYIDLLLKRYKYFDNKPITKLTIEEIKEFKNLRREMIKVVPEVKEMLLKVWEGITESIHNLINSEEFQAELLYEERIFAKVLDEALESDNE